MIFIDIYHNILWSKYKGVVFGELTKLVSKNDIALNITQIAETENNRVGLSGVDLTYHNYHFELLFKGSYNNVPKWLLIKTLFLNVWSSKASLILLPGFHTFEYWAMLLAAKLRGKMVGVFCDSTAYDKPNVFIKSIFKRIFFSVCDCFFGYGERSREYLIMHGAKPKNIFYRCQAAALYKNYNVDAVLEKRLAQVTHNTAPSFLYVGRLSPEKDLSTLLFAFANLRQNLPSAKLAFVGVGPISSDLVVLSNKLGLDSSVVFLGAKNVEELSEEYLRATCMLLPSQSEPWGLVVNEALSYGCPVIVSDRCGCVPELVIDGETGYVFKAGDVNDLAEKMQLLVRNFSQPELVAKNCLRVISKFTPLAAAVQILDGIEQTLISHCKHG